LKVLAELSTIDATPGAALPHRKSASAGPAGGMQWLRDLRQTLSYNMGYGLGCQGLPFKCPWWADKAVCGLAYIEGRKVYLESLGKN
jgi:hypothetical protein